MALDQTVTLTPNVLAQEVSGETVLLDLSGEKYFGLNEVGTRVWQLLQESGDLNWIFSTLLEEYEIEPATLERDLTQLITDMEEAHIVTVARATPKKT
jgi:sorbitol-specific phosphotransferase system component IIA